jgi:hypothetical protein
LQVAASSNPSHISDDNEEVDGADGDERAGYSNPHHNPNDSQVHTGGLILSAIWFSSLESKRVRTEPYLRPLLRIRPSRRLADWHSAQVSRKPDIRWIKAANI